MAQLKIIHYESFGSSQRNAIRSNHESKRYPVMLKENVRPRANGSSCLPICKPCLASLDKDKLFEVVPSYIIKLKLMEIRVPQGKEMGCSIIKHFVRQECCTKI